jgi:hypothetical protein
MLMNNWEDPEDFDIDKLTIQFRNILLVIVGIILIITLYICF